MIKVMIVDDERIVRQDLKELIDWESLGFEIAAEAVNGQDAIELYYKCNPQIIITDIKMPVMDGLEMARLILSKNRNVKFILLTAYDDFGYARKGIDLGVKSYVLKHEMDKEVLTSELLKIKDLLNEDINNNQRAIEHMLKRLVKGKLSFGEAEGIISKNKLPIKKGKTILLVFEFDKAGQQQSSIPNELNDFLGLPGSNVFDNDKAVIVEIEENRFAAFLIVPESYSQIRLEEKLYNICRELQDEINRLANRTISISISGILQDLDGIPAIYQKARETLRLKVFTHGQAIIRSGSIVKNKEALIIEYSKEFELFCSHMENFEIESAKSVLKKIFTDLLVQIKDVELFYRCIDRLVEVLLRVITNQCSYQMKDLLDGNALEEQLHSFDNIYQTHEWLEQVLNRIMADINLFCTRKVRDAINYIQKNYSKELSLKEMSEIIGVSPTYISVLFKKETGQSFKSYLTEYRIKKAQELLDSGKYKVYEVCEMVGYQTVQYFCSTFKRVTGNNPGKHYNK